MTVYDGVHIRTSAVDLGMNETFQIGGAGVSAALGTVEVEGEDVVRGDE